MLTSATVKLVSPRFHASYPPLRIAPMTTQGALESNPRRSLSNATTAVTPPSPPPAHRPPHSLTPGNLRQNSLRAAEGSSDGARGGTAATTAAAARAGFWSGRGGCVRRLGRAATMRFPSRFPAAALCSCRLARLDVADECTSFILRDVHVASAHGRLDEAPAHMASNVV